MVPHACQIIADGSAKALHHGRCPLRKRAPGCKGPMRQIDQSIRTCPTHESRLKIAVDDQMPEAWGVIAGLCRWWQIRIELACYRRSNLPAASFSRRLRWRRLPAHEGYFLGREGAACAHGFVNGGLHGVGHRLSYPLRSRGGNCTLFRHAGCSRLRTDGTSPRRWQCLGT